MDTRQGLTNELDEPAEPSDADLRASLDRSAAQIAAGESVPLGPVLTRLWISAERVRSERAAAVQASTSEM